MATTQSSFGRYELRGELGWGGFAIVYRAWDPALRREVAIKALLPHLARDHDLRRRFLAEAQALARLQHPNIVPVFDVGETDDRPFFAMALVDGQTLAEVLAANKQLPLPQVVEILQSLASALDELHGHGLVHRDVKPQNVMIDRSGRVVLMDLGIARALDSTSVTATGSSLGTPQYMAPEQARGMRVGPAADIYALGVLSFHLLADRPPFLGDTPSVLRAQAFDEPPSLRGMRPGLPDSVYSAIDAALSKEPEDRPASASRFVELLRGAGLTSLLIPRVDTKDNARKTELLRPSEAKARQRRRTGWLLPAMAGFLALLLVSVVTVMFISREGQPATPVAPAEGQVVPPQEPAVTQTSVAAAPPREPRVTQTSIAAAPPDAPRPSQTPVAVAPPGGQTVPRLRQTPPSADCAPVSVAPGGTTVCSIFLDGEVGAGTVITVVVTGPAGAKITACKSSAPGLLCGESAGSRLSVACRLERCVVGAQFALDVTAAGRGPLAGAISLQSPNGAAETFPFSGKATFGTP